MTRVDIKVLMNSGYEIEAKRANKHKYERNVYINS